jgi:hypothetical protein
VHGCEGCWVHAVLGAMVLGARVLGARVLKCTDEAPEVLACTRAVGRAPIRTSGAAKMERFTKYCSMVHQEESAAADCGALKPPCVSPKPSASAPEAGAYGEAPLHPCTLAPAPFAPVHPGTTRARQL